MAESPPTVAARLRALDFRRIVRYSAVSAISFPLTQVVLLICLVGFDLSGAVSNVIAVTLVAIPAYILNRYWVWGKNSKNSFTTEVLPFWGITLLGMILSTACAYYADRWFESPFAINVANALGFGVVWVFKFFLLDSWMFGDGSDSEDAELVADPAPGA
ncbi:MAG: GtrA family protein [Actinomycetota bacterium]